MQRRWLSVSLGALVAIAGFGSAQAAKIGGSPPANLTFKDIRCLNRNLSDLGEAKGYALVFLNTTCPVGQRYLPRLEELHQKYAAQGIRLVGVFNAQDELPKDIAAYGLANRLTFPLVWDEDQKWTLALGVERVPQVVLLDGAQHVVYSGRIDDQYRTGGVQPRVGRHDLAEAIDQLLAGQAISVPETPVDGCKVTGWRQPKFDFEVTFHEHVEPILQRRCQGCHHEGTAAPFGLVSYDEAQSQGEMLAEVVRDGRMPPWYAHSAFGHFSNDPTLTREERELVAAWVSGGMPQGAAEKAPKPLEFAPTAWRIGEPDLVLTMSKPQKVPATGFIPYKYVFLPPAFTEDTYVEAIEIRPHNRAVVHHCNAFYVDPSTMKADKASFITGYVPGGVPFTLVPGLAQRIPKNSVIGLQIHYVTTGQEEESTISIGFRYAKTNVDKVTHFILLDPRDIAIPPGEAFYEMAARQKLERDAILLGLFTHMHLRGRDMTFNAHYPDGTQETLLQVPNYNFEWQIGYVLPQPPDEKKLPAGTEMEAIAHFDNSTFNPYNPDPNYTVPYGDQSYDEMFNGFIFYVYEDEHLNLAIDPNTGRVLAGGAASPN